MPLFHRIGGRAPFLAALALFAAAFAAVPAPSSAAVPFMIPRYGQAVAVLPNRKIMVAGGTNSANTPVNSVEILDTTNGSEYVSPAQGAIYTTNPGGAMAFARSSATITVLPNGNVLVTGGWDGASARSDAEVYDPTANTWTTVAGMSSGRYNHTATLLLTGKVLVCGGHTDQASPATVTATCDLFTPAGAGGSFAATGSMLLGRALHTATILKDGTVWVAGGWNDGASNLNPPFVVTTERYNPATATWIQAQPLNAARAYHTATLTGDNKVLIAGGVNSNVNVDTFTFGSPATTLFIPRLGLLNSSELFDPTGGSIAPGPPMKARVEAHSAALKPDGVVTVYGGRGNIAPTNVASFENDPKPSGTINGSFTGTYSTHKITSGALTLPVETYLGTDVTGTIVDGDVEFIAPTISVNGGLATVSLDSSFNVSSTGLRASLKGVTVGCDLTAKCGYINTTLTLANITGSYSIVVPVASASSLANQGVTGSLTISPSPIDLTTNSGVADVTAGNFTTHLQIIVPNFLTGLTVSSVTLSLTPTASAGWTEASSYTVVLTGGSGLSQGPFTVQTAAGVSYIDIPAFTFNNVTGTLIVVASDPTYQITNTVTVPLGGTARLDNINFSMKYAASGIQFTGSDSLGFTSANLIVRDMIFGDHEFYTPNTSNWSFQPPSATLDRPELPRYGASAVFTPSGSEMAIGGKQCTAGCAGIQAAADGSGGSRLDPLLAWTPSGYAANDVSDPLTHAFHTATLLTDGTILLAGGTNGQSVLRNAEIFDPAAATFTPTDTLMKIPRQQHSASLLPNGRVLLAGGFTTDPSTGPTNTAEIYYPDTHEFLTTEPMISSRSQHIAVTLPNGNVFVAGGYTGINTVTGNAEIFYSTAVKWAAASPMTTLGATKKRAIAAAVQLLDGRIMLCGGTNENGILNSAIAYDPGTNAWTNLANMPVALQGHTATLLLDGRVLVAGGNDGFGETLSSFIYDPTSNTWSTGNPLNSGRFAHSANLLPNGTVMISGGVQQSALGSGSQANALQTVEFYNPDAAFWADGSGSSKLSGARTFHTATLGTDGVVYFIGGTDGSIGAGTKFYAKYDSGYFTLTPDGNSLNRPSLRQSSITTTTADAGPVLPATSFNVTGLRFRGGTEASGGGNPTNSSFSTPRLLLQKLDGANGGGPSGGGFIADMTSQIYSTPANQSTLDTSLTVTLPGNNGLPYGWYQAWVGAIDIHTAKTPVFQVGPAKPAVAATMQTPVPLGISSITFSWTGIAAPCDGYNVYSATTGVFIATVAYAGTGLTSYTLTNMLPNTTASVLVAGYTMSGDGPLAASATSYTLSTAPINVHITSVTFSSLLLQWSSNGNTESTVYEVSQSTDWPLPFSQSVSTPIPAFLATMGNQVTINQLLPNTTYTFRIQAYNNAGSSSTFSMWATTATRSNVQGVLGKALSSTSIQWSWNDAGPVTYKVYNATNAAVLITTTATTFTQTGLAVNSEHSVAVTAITGAGEGPLSPSATTYTLANQPGLLNPNLTSLTTYSFILSWSANGNPNGTTPYNVVIHEIQGSVITATTFTTTGFTLDTQALGVNLEPGVQYDSYVTAFNGEDVPSAALLISTYTLPERPKFVDPVFFLTTPTKIGVKWDQQGNSPLTRYEVTTSSADPLFAVGLTTAVPFSAGFTGSSVTMTGLITSATYWIRVRAMNPLGQTSQYSFSTNTITVNGGAPPGSLAGELLPNANTSISGNLGDGRFVQLDSPSGSFPSATKATVSPYNVVPGSTLCPGGFNVAVTITDDPDVQPIHPVYLTADYDPTSLGSVPTSDITFERYVSPGVCVPLDTEFFPNTLPRPTFRARLNHFSTYQLVQVPLAATTGSARVFPNPYRVGRDGYVTIDQIPPGSRVRIMTMMGETLLDQKTNNIGLLNWTGTNGAGRPAASGLYIVLVESGGSKKIMKLAVIR